MVGKSKAEHKNKSQGQDTTLGEDAHQFKM